MDIEIDEPEFIAPLKTTSNKRRYVLPIDDAHPFDLDAYLSSYTGSCASQLYIHSGLALVLVQDGRS